MLGSRRYALKRRAVKIYSRCVYIKLSHSLIHINGCVICKEIFKSLSQNKKCFIPAVTKLFYHLKLRDERDFYLTIYLFSCGSWRAATNRWRECQEHTGKVSRISMTWAHLPALIFIDFNSLDRHDSESRQLSFLFIFIYQLEGIKLRSYDYQCHPQRGNKLRELY